MFCFSSPLQKNFIKKSFQVVLKGNVQNIVHRKSLQKNFIKKSFQVVLRFKTLYTENQRNGYDNKKKQVEFLTRNTLFYELNII